VCLSALYKSISTILGIISQKVNGSKPPLIGPKLILVVLIEEGFWGCNGTIKGCAQTIFV
jgi:hypothetical protein